MGIVEKKMETPIMNGSHRKLPSSKPAVAVPRKNPSDQLKRALPGHPGVNGFGV